MLILCISRWGRIFIGEPIGLTSEETSGVEDQLVNGLWSLPACLSQRFGRYRSLQMTSNEIYKHG